MWCVTRAWNELLDLGACCWCAARTGPLPLSSCSSHRSDNSPSRVSCARHLHLYSILFSQPGLWASASLLLLTSLWFIHVFAVIIMFCTTGNTSQRFTYHCFVDFQEIWFKGSLWLFFQCHHESQTFFLAYGRYFEIQLWTTSVPLRWNSATTAWVGNRCISE